MCSYFVFRRLSPVIKALGSKYLCLSLARIVQTSYFDIPFKN